MDLSGFVGFVPITSLTINLIPFCEIWWNSSETVLVVLASYIINSSFHKGSDLVIAWNIYLGIGQHVTQVCSHSWGERNFSKSAFLIKSFYLSVVTVFTQSVTECSPKGAHGMFALLCLGLWVGNYFLAGSYCSDLMTSYKWELLLLVLRMWIYSLKKIFSQPQN